MSDLLHPRRARHHRKVSTVSAVAVAALLALGGCDRPAPPGPAPGTRPPERTPRTRSTAATRPSAPAVLPESGGPVVLSLAGGGHVLDCRAEGYHAGMQAALAAEGGALRCGSDGDDLALQVKAPGGGPALTVATIAVDGGRAALRWTGSASEMDCGSADRFQALRASSCRGAGLRLEAVTLRRTWP